MKINFLRIALLLTFFSCPGGMRLFSSEDSAASDPERTKKQYFQRHWKRDYKKGNCGYNIAEFQFSKSFSAYEDQILFAINAAEKILEQAKDDPVNEKMYDLGLNQFREKIDELKNAKVMDSAFAPNLNQYFDLISDIEASTADFDRRLKQPYEQLEAAKNRIRTHFIEEFQKVFSKEVEERKAEGLQKIDTIFDELQERLHHEFLIETEKQIEEDIPPIKKAFYDNYVCLGDMVKGHLENFAKYHCLGEISKENNTFKLPAQPLELRVPFGIDRGGDIDNTDWACDPSFFMNQRDFSSAIHMGMAEGRNEMQRKREHILSSYNYFSKRVQAQIQRVQNQISYERARLAKRFREFQQECTSGMDKAIEDFKANSDSIFSMMKYKAKDSLGWDSGFNLMKKEWELFKGKINNDISLIESELVSQKKLGEESLDWNDFQIKEVKDSISAQLKETVFEIEAWYKNASLILRSKNYSWKCKVEDDATFFRLDVQFGVYRLLSWFLRNHYCEYYKPNITKFALDSIKDFFDKRYELVPHVEPEPIIKEVKDENGKTFTIKSYPFVPFDQKKLERDSYEYMMKNIGILQDQVQQKAKEMLDPIHVEIDRFISQMRAQREIEMKNLADELEKARVTFKEEFIAYMDLIPRYIDLQYQIMLHVLDGSISPRRSISFDTNLRDGGSKSLLINQRISSL